MNPSTQSLGGFIAGLSLAQLRELAKHIQSQIDQRKAESDIFTDPTAPNFRRWKGAK